MKPEELLQILHTAEKLKDTTRHCDTSGGRRESVAEHSWRLALMAFLLRDEFPALDMDKVLRMCLIHDLGECFTGDIPSFLKTDADTEKEDALLARWVSSLPAPYCAEMAALYAGGTPVGVRLTVEGPMVRHDVPRGSGACGIGAANAPRGRGVPGEIEVKSNG